MSCPVVATFIPPVVPADHWVSSPAWPYFGGAIFSRRKVQQTPALPSTGRRIKAGTGEAMSLRDFPVIEFSRATDRYETAEGLRHGFASIPMPGSSLAPERQGKE